MDTFVRARLWIFDFDGTLSPLVQEREQARLHPDCKQLLMDLAMLPHQQVAILSSRSLDDLVTRVPVPGVYLGGGSGIEWLFPDGRRILSEGKWEERLEQAEGTLRQLGKMARLPGIEIEDKRWSAAIHTRKATPENKEKLLGRIAAWQSPDTVRVFRGPEVLEIQFFPEVDKAFGVRTLCEMLKFDLSSGTLVYAGDDENDAVAMRWAIALGGAAFMVGNSFPVVGARRVKDQLALVSDVRAMAGIGA